jgi:hypothetical protein
MFKIVKATALTASTVSAGFGSSLFGGALD